jgi:hypothetical protein
MATTIVTKYGGDAPAASDIVRGELAVDTENGRLYTENAAGAVVEIGLNPEGNVDVTGSISADGLTVDGAATITVTDNSDTLTLVSTDADANVGPVLNLFRNSASPADNDLIGRIVFKGDDSAGNAATYARIETIATDVTNGSEDGRLDFYTAKDDAFSAAMSISGTNVGIGTGSPDRLLTLQGDNSYMWMKDAGGGNVAFIGGDGSNDGFLRLYNGSHTAKVEIQSDGNTYFNGGNVGIGVADGDVTGDGTAARTYVGIIGTANRGRLNIGSTASNGADAGTLVFTNGTNSLADLTVDTTAGVQNTGTLYINGTRSIKIQAASADEVVFNEGSTSSDFRVESTDNANMIKLDGTNNRVGIGKSPASNPFEVAGFASFDSGISVAGEVGVAPSAGTAKVRLTSQGAGSEVFSVNGQIPGVSNGGFAIRNETDSRNDFTISAAGVSTFGNKTIISAADGACANDYVAVIANLEETDGQSFGLSLNAGSNVSDIALNVTDHDGANGLLRVFGNGAVTVNGGAQAGGDFTVVSDSNANCLFVDAEYSHVKINTSTTPSATQAGFLFTTDQFYTSAGATTNTNTQVRFINGNGLVGSISTAGSGTAYATSSDQRLKDNIADANDAGELIDAIQVRQFDWKKDGEHQRYGMVAQELDPVAPEAVIKTDDPDDMMAVDYSKLVPMLVKEIQSLRARVAQLEA